MKAIGISRRHLWEPRIRGVSTVTVGLLGPGTAVQSGSTPTVVVWQTMAGGSTARAAARPRCAGRGLRVPRRALPASRLAVRQLLRPRPGAPAADDRAP